MSLIKISITYVPLTKHRSDMTDYFIIFFDSQNMLNHNITWKSQILCIIQIIHIMIFK